MGFRGASGGHREGKSRMRTAREPPRPPGSLAIIGPCGERSGSSRSRWSRPGSCPRRRRRHPGLEGALSRRSYGSIQQGKPRISSRPSSDDFPSAPTILAARRGVTGDPCEGAPTRRALRPAGSRRAGIGNVRIPADGPGRGRSCREPTPRRFSEARATIPRRPVSRRGRARSGSRVTGPRTSPRSGTSTSSRTGDAIVIEMPYASFTYEVEFDRGRRADGRSGRRARRPRTARAHRLPPPLQRRAAHRGLAGD